MGGQEIMGGIPVQEKPTQSQVWSSLRLQAVTSLRPLHGREGEGEEGQRAREVGGWCSEGRLVGGPASRTRDISRMMGGVGCLGLWGGTSSGIAEGQEPKRNGAFHLSAGNRNRERGGARGTQSCACP